MTKRLDGKVALVTGAATGIGRATAERFAQEGAKVVAGIAEEGQRPIIAAFDALVLDVRSAADWDRAIEYAEEAHGGLDILVNNAEFTAQVVRGDHPRTLGRGNGGEPLGTFLGCKTVIPAMRRRGGGAIVNLCSINGITGVPGATAYSASKGGVLALTMALAMEHVGDGIRVNCVCPGPVETPIIDAMVARSPDPAALRAVIAAKQPMGRMATPGEVAAGIAFLASNDASYMTGLAVPVDGGRTVR